MFDKILIANRGEIACRVARTARRLGIRTVAVYSQADAGARHVRMADEAILIGGAEPKDSYLAIGKIIAAAQRTGAEAIHPGYGFLSENELLRQACDQAGLVFVGPPLAALRAMGSKSQARALMQAAGVPLAPGYHEDDQDPARLQGAADAIGYPVLIKPALGGGGKGMRLVEAPEEFNAALASCRREAAASFGDDHVLIEKYISRPRHIEIQIFADAFGDCVSLFERDCSTQRRHQKVLEEAPAPGLSEARRRAMSEAALAAARAVGYVGAGTVEFIVALGGAFYFIEMNARLQVEHPVTEFITGLDLVEWQLRVAAGERLPLRQDQIVRDGHALEARLYAEDPAKNFMPATGRLRYLQLPEQSRHVRVDSGVEEGDSVTPFYDPMIGKLIVWDENRDRALARMRQALTQVQIVGLANNVEFLSRLVACPSFVKADLGTDLIERESAFLFADDGPPPREASFIVALAALLSERATEFSHGVRPASPWRSGDNWRLNVEEPRLLSFSCAGATFLVAVRTRGDGFALGCDDVEILARGERDERGRMRVELGGASRKAICVATESGWSLFLDGRVWTFVQNDPLHVAEREDPLSGGLTAPMSGRVTALMANPGSMVRKGAPLMILEAMKMEHVVAAPTDGLLKSFFFALGDQVAEGAKLIAFEPSNGDSVQKG
jgi:3-methylcrotonyl-CoA carboxylase alpha subunit